MKEFKKVIFLAIVLSFFCLAGVAQVPGYMGKKVVIGYGLFGNPAFGNIAMDYADTPINIQHDFFAEYTTGKKFALGFSARLYRYTYNNVEQVDAGGGTTSTSVNQNQLTPNGSYKIKARNYSLYGKFFKSHYLAPWGKYFVLGLTLINYKTFYDPGTMYIDAIRNINYSAVSFRPDFGPTEQSYQKADIFFGHGNSRIFGNRIVLDYGYTINVIALTRVFVTALDVYEEEYPETYIKNTSASRVAAVNRFNFYIKLGYLF